MVNNMENILENIVKKQNFKKIKTGEMLKKHTKHLQRIDNRELYSVKK